MISLNISIQICEHVMALAEVVLRTAMDRLGVPGDLARTMLDPALNYRACEVVGKLMFKNLICDPPRSMCRIQICWLGCCLVFVLLFCPCSNFEQAQLRQHFVAAVPTPATASSASHRNGPGAVAPG